MNMKTFPKIISAFAIAGLLATSLTACGDKTQTGSTVSANGEPAASEVIAKIPDWQTLDGDGYSVQYPKDWNKEANPVNATGFMIKSPKKDANDQFLENVNLIVQDMQGEKPTLDQLAALIEQKLGKMLTNFSMDSKKEGKSGGKDFLEVRYSGEQGPMKMKFAQRIYMAGDKGYILTTTSGPSAEARVDESLDKIVSSFQLK